MGTLTIMGVMAIMGIIGFRFLMNGVKANSILHEVNTRAHACASQFGLLDKTECVLGEYSAQIDGKYTATPLKMDNGYFGIQVAEVPESICHHIKANGMPLASFLLPENCETTNTMKFIFDQALTGKTTDIPKACLESSECGDCSICGASGFCEYTCTGNSTCTTSFDEPDSAKICCPAENLVDGVCCTNPDGNGNCCDSSNDNCCPPDKPILGRDSTCYGCDGNITILVNEKTHKCNRCTNRVYRSATYSYVGWCVPKECPEETPLMSYDGKCYSCGTTVNVRDGVNGAGSTSSCARCPDDNSVFDDRICLPCPNDMIVANGRCTCASGFMAGYTNNSYLTQTPPVCFSCGTDNLNAIAYHRGNKQKPCLACPNRIVVQPQINNYYYCALETCPTGYMHDRYGHCRSCSSYSGNIEFQPSSLTNSCSECGGLRYTDGNYCKKCPLPSETAKWEALSPTQQAECSASTS